MVMESLATNIVTEMLLKPKTVPIIPPAPKEPEDTGPQLVQIVAKGAPVRVFEHASANGLSETDRAVDCRNFNMVHVDVFPNGTSPSATITLEGADEAGAPYNALPGANGRHPAITANYSFEAPVGTAWLKVRIADISGTFGAGLGFTVVVTPFVGTGLESVNHAVALLSSAARTAETNSADQTSYNASALIVFVNVSSITATPVLTPRLQIKDSISGNYFTIWSAATTITATGQYAYLFALGGNGSAGSFTEAVNLQVGRAWRFQMGVGDADSATYSVSGEILI